MQPVGINKKTQRQERRALLILLAYRLLLASLLLVLIFGNFQLQSTILSDRTFFIYTTFSYLGLIAISGLSLFRNWFSPTNQALAMFLVDAVVIPLLIHSGSGVTTALGSLLASSIALTSLLVRGRMVLFLAAIATFGIFSEAIYESGLQQLDTKAFTRSGLLGAVYFAIALLAATLSKRVRESESLAKQRARELADLAQLNEQIIEQMNTGVVVGNDDGDIRYFNQAARHLLDISGGNPGMLRQAHPQLDNLRIGWLQGGDFADNQHLETEQRQLRAHFRRSGVGNTCMLIFLEDASEAMKQARQIKLASLGRLTAGIAHQIRNPLSSINHAGQLLAESESIPDADRRLTEIIRGNAKRVNEIIESILQLSRRQAPRRQEVILEQWLMRFIEAFSTQHKLSREQISLIANGDTEAVQVHIDSMQLEQVIGNLCENALQHSGRGEAIRLTLRLSCNEASQPQLTVCDNGKGLPADTMEKLFEPFFTTRSDGTGLGLYIARELCEANDIALNPLTGTEGTCFHMLFRHKVAHD